MRSESRAPGRRKSQRTHRPRCLLRVRDSERAPCESGRGERSRARASADPRIRLRCKGEDLLGATSEPDRRATIALAGANASAARGAVVAGGPDDLAVEQAADEL